MGGGGEGGKGGLRPIWKTSLFLWLHARARDASHQSMDEGRSAPVHAKKLYGKGTNKLTDRLCDYYNKSAQWADLVKN